ncbi:MAG TPA: hypothetical protein ENJ32_02640 [Crenotrichaceae bacterium]|nr:hypothetical protein [Crenotrichaceae bacterium]
MMIKKLQQHCVVIRPRLNHRYFPNIVDHHIDLTGRKQDNHQTAYFCSAHDDQKNSHWMAVFPET